MDTNSAYVPSQNQQSQIKAFFQASAVTQLNPVISAEISYRHLVEASAYYNK